MTTSILPCTHNSEMNYLLVLVRDEREHFVGLLSANLGNSHPQPPLVSLILFGGISTVHH